jgi:hypothetical protein
MTRHEQFILLVQTAAIVESVTREGAVGKRRLALIALHCAMKVKEADLPEDLTEACEQLIRHVYHNALPKPPWLTGII